MNSLERVIRTCRHQQADRIPLDLGSSFTTGITRNACQRLCKHFGHDQELELYDVIQQLAVVPDSVLEQLGVDVRGLVPNVVRKAPSINDLGSHQAFEDEWGITWTRPQGSLYFSAGDSKLSGSIQTEDIEAFPWPDPTSPALFTGLKEQAQTWHEQGYAIILESFFAGVFEMAGRIRGVEQFYMDLALDPDLALSLMDKLVELKLQFYQAAAEHLGPYIQFIREGDDIAGQESLLISPQMYHDFLKPRHRSIIEAQRTCFPQPFFVWFHSCGGIYDLLPDFIEAGVDVINPLQLTARGMDAQKIKRQYGRDLSFWGGGVNTQEILPRGTVEEVKADVAARIQALGHDGGYVFGTVHNIQDDVPLENILAMLEVYDEMKN